LEEERNKLVKGGMKNQEGNQGQRPRSPPNSIKMLQLHSIYTNRVYSIFLQVSVPSTEEQTIGRMTLFRKWERYG